MTSLLTVLTVVGAQLRDRLRDVRDEPERGSLSVEQVIITVALIGIAVALVPGIANAVSSRSAQIQYAPRVPTRQPSTCPHGPALARPGPGQPGGRRDA